MQINRVYEMLKWLLLPVFILLGGCSLANYPLIDTAGPVGHEELHLIITAFLIMLIPVVPVILMTLWFSWRYRAANKNAAYRPTWAHSNGIEAVVWIIPLLIVIGLSVLSWETTHQLNPYQPLAGENRPLTEKPVHIEVIALDWKWLFIYPDQHIAAVNQLVVPTNTPLDLRLTSDTVMTSFFIPRLGTQIYAMAGMRTKLHLLANQTGSFLGENTQISGVGYAKMHFNVLAETPRHFATWVTKVQHSSHRLDMAAYRKLEHPSLDNPVTHYSIAAPHALFSGVISKYVHDKPLAGSST